MDDNWEQKLNEYGRQRKPCFFTIDFSGSIANITPIENLEKANIRIQFPDYKSSEPISSTSNPLNFEKEVIPISLYKDAFEKVLTHLHRGDSYLTNLTFATPIKLNLELKELYSQIQAKYKILFKDQWLCFSPETFITINGSQIATFPMKGTIDADIPNAASILKHDPKEKAEHSTIVDLLRNDLSLVASDVRVQHLMYLEKVKTSNGHILQMSSEIKGILSDDWHKELGTILKKLLPAGSICGAPKRETLKIIREAENYNRGFYTGVAGYYDGERLDSCVLIRFIERTDKGYKYKSGGGITAKSDMIKEYKELNQKIYVPVH